MNDLHNVIIIGGGPSGLSAAIYIARAGLQPLVFAGSPPGGQLMLTSEVENFPGYQEIMGPDLIQTLRKQAEHFGTMIKDENITFVDFKQNPHTVKTTKAEYRSKSVIIATGAQALWLGLESEQKLRGKGVSACATCDGFFFRDKEVAIVGGGDTAMEEAQTLTRFAKKVYLIHRRELFRASKIMQERVMNNPKIELVLNNEIVTINGESKVEGITLKSPHKNNTVLPVNGVFVAIGHKPDTTLFKDSIELDEKGYVITTATHALSVLAGGTAKSIYNPKFQTMTSVQGVFAGGDCVDHVYRQASTAAGMGVAAALDAERWIEEN
ncbi:thioredoxin-disulfide reductase [Candidatus Roizmanbacteria bacterium]|nr:MAG: thioredoxin-disulfide reductase [Candidatus Roizmanbacteria bacterium]